MGHLADLPIDSVQRSIAYFAGRFCVPEDGERMSHRSQGISKFMRQGGKEPVPLFHGLTELSFERPAF
jgi:hypothetical protein